MALITIERETNLNNVPISVDVLHGMMFSKEAGAHKFLVTCTKDGEQVQLTGAVTAYVLLTNGHTQRLESGGTTPYTGIENGKAWATLHQACYAVPGRFQISIFVTDTHGVTTCVYAAVGVIQRSATNNEYDPGDAVPTINNLEAWIAACQQATREATAAAQGVDDIVLVQSAQPTSESNKIWIQPQADEYQVPTLEEHEELAGEVEDLKSAISNTGILPITTPWYIGKGYIEEGVWKSATSNTYCHCAFPVKGGESIKITANASSGLGIAALTDYVTPVTGVAPSFSAESGWTNAISITKGTTYEGTLPSDARYLYLNMGGRSNFSRKPVSCLIDGYDYANELVDNLALLAPLASPAFTGEPTAPTPATNDNSTKIATTAYVKANVSDVISKTLALESDNSATIVDETNIDELLTPGTYKVTSAAHAATLNGTPPFSNIGYSLIVLETTQNNRVWQICCANGNNRLRYRRYSGSSWSEWIVVADTTYVRDSLLAVPARLRLMQYNCGMWAMGGNGPMTSENYNTKIENYKKMFCHYQPDILGIQEWVEELNISGISGTQNMNTIMFDPVWPYNADDIAEGSAKGRTIKSRYPIVDIANGKIDKSILDIDSNVRYSKGHVNYCGRRICFLSTAFAPTSVGVANMEKRAQLMPLLLNLIKDEEYAFMLCDVNNVGSGDTSDGTPYSRSSAEGNSLNAIAEANGFKAAMGSYIPWTNSYKAYSDPTKTVPIDNIYYRNNGKTLFVNYEVLMSEYDSLNSDHAPCIGDFILL